jgi:pyridoxamine 5'-phosphate oxidase
VSKVPLDEASVGPDPLSQVRRWLEEAFAARIPNADAMALATATAGGRPAARFVLLKGIEADGFVFYTNTESRKGRELAENPRAAIALYWVALGRQVRAAGRVEQLPRAAAEAYFATRPAGSRLAAAISRQSQPVESRHELERRYAELGAAHPEDVPMPPDWGGYRIDPDEIELWEHRENRLHDRLRYTRAADGWRLERLQP